MDETCGKFICDTYSKVFDNEQDEARGKFICDTYPEVFNDEQG